MILSGLPGPHVQAAAAEPRNGSWSSVDFKDLERRGFVLIRSFLTEAEVGTCRQDFAAQSVSADNRNYNLSHATHTVNETLRKRVEVVLARVREATDLRVDLPLSASYFATARGVNFGWHQDHESFFSTQNHYDYLNFYIPIVKPERDKSNLSIIPFDVLEKECPEVYRRVVRCGATRFVRRYGRLLILFDEPGTAWLGEDFLDRLRHTPGLEPGDLLLVRGDIIHRTQDTDTERVSLSFRAARSETPVLRKRLAGGGLAKAWVMMNNPGAYEPMFRAFDVLGRGSVGFAELQQAVAALPPGEWMGRKRFARFLLWQKTRNGVLLEFFHNTLRTWAGLLVAALRARLLAKADPTPQATK
jgi:hypothetical protein